MHGHMNVIWKIGASGWFYYKEICYDAARSHVTTQHGHMSRRSTVTWTKNAYVCYFIWQNLHVAKMNCHSMICLRLLMSP
jgi:hypothetical protein